MLLDSDNFLQIRNPTDFQTQSSQSSFSKARVHHSSHSAISHTKVNKYERNITYVHTDRTPNRTRTLVRFGV